MDWNNKKEVLEAVKKDGLNFEYVSEALRNDREVVLEAVKRKGSMLKYASEELRNDKEVVLEALKRNCLMLIYASEELRNDKEVVLVAVKRDGFMLKHAPKEFSNDREVVLEAVKNESGVFEYVSEALRNDREVVLEAVKRKGSMLKYASEELRNDREVVLEAVKNDSGVLEYVSEELRNDKEVVLEAVKRDGFMLEHAPKEFRNDREVVLEAVKNDSRVLGYVSEELRNDKEVVLEAIKRDGSMLKYASEELRNDKKIKRLVEAKSELDYIERRYRYLKSNVRDFQPTSFECLHPEFIQDRSPEASEFMFGDYDREKDKLKREILELTKEISKKLPNFEFVRNGTTCEQVPEENTIWVDVGNKMEKGVLDHHGEQSDGCVCATEIIYKNQNLVLDNITDPNKLKIVGHILPDFDCVASAYLVNQLAQNRKLTPEVEKLVEYAKLTDTGKINPGRENVENPYSILNSFMYMPENSNISFDELNKNFMKKGFELIDYCLERVKTNPELTFESKELIEDTKFKKEKELLKEASSEYEKALESAEKTKLVVPTLDKKSKEVEAVFVKEIPENELTRDMMKNWLRDEGYVFTSIPVYDSHNFKTDEGKVLDDVKTSRVIISVAPGNDVHLEGLGKEIEEKENSKCAELGIKRYTKDREGNVLYSNRPGYESPDPWYDGRGHNYEIIDGPMSGSVLTVEEINDITKQYSRDIEHKALVEDVIDCMEEKRNLEKEIEKNIKKSK